MNQITSGPNVNDHLQTEAEGVFACGNVLHVHDLVDYVSEEANLAGRNAAAYVKKETAERKQREVRLEALNGVRYTVPQSLDIRNMNDQGGRAFRVADVYEDRFISVYYGDESVETEEKRFSHPEEMEQVILKKDSFKNYPDLEKIVICTEVE